MIMPTIREFILGCYRLFTEKIRNIFCKHTCMFRKKDALNLDINPKCIICKKPLE